MATAVTVDTIQHPGYKARYQNWQKWRDVYEGGQRFIDVYLYKYSNREGGDYFQRRKEVTYNPAFAKEAIDEVKNSIFQRLVDISRKGGSKSYQASVDGISGGVDLLGASMNSFIGRRLLPELLTMSRVGVYVDMPAVDGLTLVEAQGKQPYLYMYRTEDIRSWSYAGSDQMNEFSNLLLQDYYDTYDDVTGLPTGTDSRYRRLWLQDGFVNVQFYNKIGEKIDAGNNRSDEAPIRLPITRIPFVLVEISDSLLADVANYQIALMNLASSDMAYALQSNFPFYTEQFEPRAASEFMRKPSTAQGGEATDGEAAKTQEVRVGNTQGRRYPKGMERPGFIHPSSEPLTASMAKQEQMKAEIRQLVNLAVGNLQPTKASAESKSMDNQGLESGLSYIGLELENMERKIAEYWAMYEKSKVPTINYPTNYSLKSDAERSAETEKLTALLPVIPSITLQKAICKRIAELTVGRQITNDELLKIRSEIDNAKAMTADPVVIASDVEIGVLDLELASEIRGYPKGTVEKATKDHTDRLARIAESQSKNNGQVNGGAARGVPALDGNPAGTGSQEKKQSTDTTQDPVVKNKQRGKGQ